MTPDGQTEIDGLFCISHPATGGKQTFAFVNALTGSTDQWEARIAPALREHGYGSLSYNFRGQANTTYTADDALDEAQIIADLKTVLKAKAQDNTILVGLSIGGLFAARTFLDGSPVAGLVLINTLRQPDLTLEWTNEAIYRAARLGGSQLVMDMFLPGLVGPEKLKELRANCLGDSDYEPLPKDSGILRLIEKSRATNWKLPYEQLDLPVLVMTGLRDRIFLNREVVSNLVERLPKPYHVELPEAGHLIPAEDPDAVVDVLKRFAEDLSRD